MPAQTKKPLDVLRNAALIAAGLSIAAIPLAFWVAWDEATFVLGLGAGAAFGLLCFVLYADTRVTNEERRKDSSSRTMEYLDHEFLSELSDMGPFVYHNRLSGDFRFRRRMVRLKKKLWHRVLVFVIACHSAPTLPALAFECPKPEAGSAGTLAESPGEIERLSALLASDDVENRLDVMANDLKRKHPQADPAELANFMLTAYCPVVAAGEGSDAEKRPRRGWVDMASLRRGRSSGRLQRSRLADPQQAVSAQAKRAALLQEPVADSLLGLLCSG